MIFEYGPLLGGAGSEVMGKSSPNTAIALLIIGCLAWSALIYWSYRRFMVPIWKEHQNIQSILKEGHPVVAHIESKSIEREKAGAQTLDLEISFKNLEGVLVHVPFSIEDLNPQEKRFEEGEFIAMRIDPNLNEPVLLPEGVEVDQKDENKRLMVISFFGLITFAFLSLIFSYWFQNDGTGWRFLHFWHPWICSPLLGLTCGLIIFNLVVDFLYITFNNKMSKAERTLIFKGKPAIAHILSADQTGLLVNEQPEIMFKIQFTDEKGNLRTAKFKKIVSLLNMDKLGARERIILYLPESPHEVMFADDYVKI